MGVLHYDNKNFEFEDRLLAHLQMVVGLKLRRSECFYVSWRPTHQSGTGRQALWIATGVPLHFEYFGGRAPAMNREWIEILVTGANSGSGLTLSDERSREPVALE